MSIYLYYIVLSCVLAQCHQCCSAISSKKLAKKHAAMKPQSCAQSFIGGCCAAAMIFISVTLAMFYICKMQQAIQDPSHLQVSLRMPETVSNNSNGPGQKGLGEKKGTGSIRATLRLPAEKRQIKIKEN